MCCRITIREAGLFVFAEVFDLGLVLQWDRGTRVYVRADPRWKDRVSGYLFEDYLDFKLFYHIFHTFHIKCMV
jgi:hypothetical protein